MRIVISPDRMVYYKWIVTTEKMRWFCVWRLIKYEGSPDVCYYGHRETVMWHKVCDISEFAVDLPVACSLPKACCVAYSMPQSCIKGPVHSMKACKESRRRPIGQPILNLGTGCKVAVKLKPRPLYRRGKTPRYPLHRRMEGGCSEAGLGILDKTETSHHLRDSNLGFSSP
jgi:hypothetical protein